MRRSRVYTADDEARLRRAWQEYDRLAMRAGPSYKLAEMFDLSDRSIAVDAHQFKPNANGQAARALARSWAESYQLWMPGTSEHVVGMASYLYPAAAVPALAAAAKLSLLDYYVNDTIGRDRVGLLPPSARRSGADLAHRMIEASTVLRAPTGASQLEHACVDVLRGLRESSARQWFDFLTAKWIDHLRTMGTDANARARGRIWSERQYAAYRMEASGMPYTLALTDYVDGRQPGWPAMRDRALATSLRRLRWLCGLIGAFSNDLFSLENEFVAARADANLVLVILLNQPDRTFADAVQEGIGRVNRLVTRFSAGLAATRARCERVVDPPLRADIHSLLRSLEAIHIACWCWQTHTRRYRFNSSIFAELRLGPDQAAPAAT